ncbi:MAG: tetratricopeptide repeat protein [Mariprofundaceae bacterium]|nr:tetratricopeptide repeat protein [Mariprofundaceae bacterium]
MLTASLPTPNHSSPKHASGRAPRPQNWQGVESGLAEAARLFQQDDLSRAEEVIRRVLEFAPVEGQAWHLLGRILQGDNRHAEALECFASAETAYGYRKHGQRPPASIRLARLLWNLGECEQARTMLDTLILRRPDDENLRQLREAWLQQGGCIT